MAWVKSRLGFTIVELLIVIVVIAILAAITIIAYTGVQGRARVASVQSAVSQAAKNAPLYALENNDLFPDNEATFFNFARIADTSDTDYTYLVSTDRTRYCLSATSSTDLSVSYAVTDTTGGIVSGRCVRNLTHNPSFELVNGVSTYLTSTSWQSNGGSNSDRYVRGTRTATTGSWGLWWDALNNSNQNQTYAFSFMSRQSVLTSRDMHIEWLNAAKSSLVRRDTVQNQQYSTSWTQFSGSATSPSESFNVRIAFYAYTNGSLADYVDIDSVMVVEGSVPYVYADGSFPGWAWDGSPHTSSSFGPAIAL